MNFDNADIRVVVKFISELTGKNFIIDDKVKGTATIISPSKISIDEAYRVFESILEVKGYTAVPTGKIIKIVPSQTARAKDILTKTGKEISREEKKDRIITQIVPLEHANASELKGLLTPLMSKTSSLIAYQETNTMIMTDYASNIHRLIRIINEIDIPGPSERISVVRLTHASAKTLAAELTSLIETSGRAVPKRRPRKGKAVVSQAIPIVSKVVPDDRTNSLVVLASADDTKKLLELIEKLDQPIPKGRSRVNVYYLENASAEELVKVLTQLPSKVKGAKAAPGRPSAPILGEEVVIMADKPTNSLIITASPQDYETLKEVIQKLDIIRSQVLVKALIAEVSLEKTQELGIEWYGIGQSGNTAVIAGSATAGRAAGVKTPAAAAQIGAEGLLLGALKGPITFAGQEIFQMSALVKAFQSSADTNIISTPTLLTMDNEEAEIVIGEERPFLKSDVTSVQTGETTTRTFEFKDIATTLRITPQISKGKFVRLKVFQEVKNFKGELEPGALITTKRQAKTTVMVENGQMVVIGGLLLDQKNLGGTMVPCLGNLPILGWLFKSRKETDLKANLLIFITPYIINTPEDLTTVTEELQEESEKTKKGYEKQKKEELKKNLELFME
jgi:general secretion pathway protein D